MSRLFWLYKYVGGIVLVHPYTNMYTNIHTRADWKNLLDTPVR